jgi:hypothetical protein
MLKLIDLSAAVFRGLGAWMALASRVFPTPVSPMITSGSVLVANCGIFALSRVIEGLRPMMRRESGDPI